MAADSGCTKSINRLKILEEQWHFFIAFAIFWFYVFEFKRIVMFYINNSIIGKYLAIFLQFWCLSRLVMVFNLFDFIDYFFKKMYILKQTIAKFDYIQWKLKLAILVFIISSYYFFIICFKLFFYNFKRYYQN